MTSFNTLSLNGSTLSVNGTDYNLSLSQTAEATDSSLSSFKGVAAVDNGDGTISLTVGENSVRVEKYVKPMPVKGDIITMNVDGTDKSFRVLKNVSDTIYEVIQMYGDIPTVVFGENNEYEASNLDTYLNSTIYNTFSSSAKNAIVSKTFSVDSWSMSASGNPDYVWKYVHSNGNTYIDTISLRNASYGQSITRYVYAISVQDVIDYLDATPSMTSSDTTLTGVNMKKMLWNTEEGGSPSTWMRSKNYASSNPLILANGFLNGATTSLRGARMMFQIDLSKIVFAIS